MSGGLRSHVCVDPCPNSYVSWMYQLRTPSEVICTGWCLPIFSVTSNTAFYRPTRINPTVDLMSPVLPGFRAAAPTSSRLKRNVEQSAECAHQGALP